MTNTFSASEIVEIGIQIEVNGKDFYNTVAESVKNKKAGKVFSYLAGEEKKHAETFREILSEVQNYEPREAYPQEYFAYMRSFAENKVFTAPNMGKETAKGVKNEKEAVDLGMDSERYSISFYESMKKIVPERDRNMIEELIKEEKSHLKKLEELKEAL